MARATDETWVHPVTIGVEPVSNRLAVWRFRLVLLVGMLVLAAALFLAIAKVKGGTDSPASGLRAPLPHVLVVSGSEHL